MPVKPTEQDSSEFFSLRKPNLSSVRWAKSSQGSRSGTCGWITSFFSFQVFLVQNFRILHGSFHIPHITGMFLIIKNLQDLKWQEQSSIHNMIIITNGPVAQ